MEIYIDQFREYLVNIKKVSVIISTHDESFTTSLDSLKESFEKRGLLDLFFSYPCDKSPEGKENKHGTDSEQL